MEWIDEGAFQSCINLTEVSLPESLTSLASGAFEKCSSLDHIVLPANLVEISDNVFAECGRLQMITINSKIDKIPYAFAYGSGLKEISIPEGVVSIDGEAFDNCEQLKEIYLPSTLKKINKGAFSSTERLSIVYLLDLDSWWSVNLSSSSANPMYYNNAVVCDGNTGEVFEEIAVPKNINIINDYIFTGAKDLKKIHIHKNVTYIGNSSFEDCFDISDIYYEGTKKDWNKLDKASDWIDNVDFYTIHCSDGDI